MRETINRYGGSAAWLLAGTLFLVILIAGTVLLNLSRLRQHSEWVQHTNDAIAAISAIQHALLNAESNERAYLLTAIDEFAKDFELSRVAVGQSIDSLRQMVSDNPVQIANVDRLRTLADGRLAQLQHAAMLGPARLPDAVEYLKTARMDGLTQQAITLLTGMTNVERSLLDRRQKDLQRSSTGVAIASTLLLLLALAGAVFTTFLIEHQRAIISQRLSDLRIQGLQSELMHVARLSTMGGMASALAHELNQPLSAITNYVNGAIRILRLPKPDTERAIVALEKGVQQGLRAGAIIKRLREFVSRGETDRRDESIRAIVDESLALISVVQRDRPVNVTLRLDPLCDQVHVDRIQIQQVLVNLLRNAFEAMRDQSERKLSVVSTPVSGGMVELAVADNGPGIDPAIVERLFQPFSTTKADGMGVGLSISQTIIQAHGGDITVEAKAEGGTIFRISLPSATQNQQEDRGLQFTSEPS
ncbi:CHASE3 domain-containing protein [Rhodopseudomonas sp. P1]|uniref:ATP-binding protein n=1 Tax=Rhodopseudomonas sp. P1 TaxID=3434357 RepID=UPI0031FBD35B